MIEVEVLMVRMIIGTAVKITRIIWIIMIVVVVAIVVVVTLISSSSNINIWKDQIISSMIYPCLLLKYNFGYVIDT